MRRSPRRRQTASLKKTIQDTSKFLSPVTEALKKQKDLFAAAEVPKDEVTKELEKLKQEDPIRRTHQADPEHSRGARRLSAALTASMEDIEQALTKISEHYLQLAELLPELRARRR